MLNNLIEETLNEAKQIGYKKGDRVIVNYNTAKKPEYYIGTVSMVRNGLIHVKFDNDDKGKYKPTKSKTGLIGLAKPNKKRKSEIPADKINSWLLTKPDNKTAVKSNVVKKKIREPYTPPYTPEEEEWIINNLVASHGPSSTWEGKYDEVLIHYDKGKPTWKKLEGVDINKQKVAVAGSDSKKRWIPFPYIGHFWNSAKGSLIPYKG